MTFTLITPSHYPPRAYQMRSYTSGTPIVSTYAPRSHLLKDGTRGPARFISQFGHQWLITAEQGQQMRLLDDDEDEYIDLSSDARLIAEHHFSRGRFDEFMTLINSEVEARQHVLLPDEDWLSLLRPIAVRAQEMVRAMDARAVAVESMRRIRDQRA